MLRYLSCSLNLGFHVVIRRASFWRGNMFLAMVCGSFCTVVAVAEEEPASLEPVVVVSSRYPDAAISQSAFGATSVDRKEMERLPQARLDDMLKSAVPGFSLFRRSSSEAAHPTTQGPGLRNLGPNGAGRTLVLLDGVPQNDPFGGWVYWNRLPPDLLENVTVVRGGGAGLFGNNALGGTLYLTRHEPDTLSASLLAGDRETFEGTLMSSLDAGPFRITSTLQGQSAAGYPVVRDDQRGPVDIRAGSTSYLFETGIATTLESGTEVALRGSWFEEDRDNGTPFTGNHTQALDLSLGLRGPEGDARWEALLFYQERRFESTFSSVNPERTAEVPALDQYEVPAHSLGFSLTTAFAGGLPLFHADKEGSKLVTGVDARWIQGETRERFRFMEGAFLNGREAGGSQMLLGAFAEQTWKMPPDLLLTLGGRMDYWRTSHGRRVERVIATGDTLLDEAFADQDGVVASGRLGAVFSLTDEWQIKGGAYTGFRVPTLNELYRPFRVRNDITGANEALLPEKLSGVEAGIQWEPAESLHLGVTVFWNHLADAVANVTLLNGPGVAPDGTVVPDGGVYRQRQNIDAVSTTGIELEARWDPVTWLGLSAGCLLTETRVSAVSEALDGRELAQAPARVVTGALTWRPAARWQALLQARHGSEQFEDDLNTLVLNSYVVWDASVTCQVNERLSIALVMENLFDRTVETGRSADGIVSVGAPRWLGIKMKWDF